jgi:hypothetical protein
MQTISVSVFACLGTPGSSTCIGGRKHAQILRLPSEGRETILASGSQYAKLLG